MLYIILKYLGAKCQDSYIKCGPWLSIVGVDQGFQTTLKSACPYGKETLKTELNASYADPKVALGRTVGK